VIRQGGVLLALFLGSLGNAWAAEKVTYYYTNEQGTPLVTADEKGVVLTTVDYRPYGEQVLGASEQGPGYTGHVNDADTGLVYMQQRYYDPVVGRFLSADPIAPIAGQVMTFGRFTYGNNNPIRNIDPDGRQATMGMPTEAVHLTYSESQKFVGIVVPGYTCATEGCGVGGWAMEVAGVLPVGRLGALGRLAINSAEGASAAERAASIAGAMGTRTQRSVTVAVTETKEGMKIVSSSEQRLRPAAIAMLGEGEVAIKGAAGTHAEVNGINAARNMGLTPTGTAASRPICPSCAKVLNQQGVVPLSRLKE
jgi:RHS repeat-associated protein